MIIYPVTQHSEEENVNQLKKTIQNKKIVLTYPDCASGEIIKKEKRINKHKEVQLYLCKDCGKRFSNEKFKGLTYPIATIAKSLSKYNCELTIEETAKKQST